MVREFSTSGRLNRGGFWLRQCTSVPLGLWAVIAAGQIPGPPFDLPVVVGFVALLVSLWGRRLHDRGRSAWWLLVLGVPVLGGLWLLIECAVRGSAAGVVRFGAAPGARPGYLRVDSEPGSVA
jgi:uncharacterized membrane protein YhaH (DUF805 family)